MSNCPPTWKQGNGQSFLHVYVGIVDLEFVTANVDEN